MASRIKGITVEIGGDTSGLEKSLAAVNNSIKKTQSQLRDVNNLLKLDPSNTILLAQKQELLQSAIGDTEKELEATDQLSVVGDKTRMWAIKQCPLMRRQKLLSPR